MKVLVLGSTGMLGSAVLRALELDRSKLEIFTLDRSRSGFDAASLPNAMSMIEAMVVRESINLIVNLIGMTKVSIAGFNQGSKFDLAEAVNTSFPKRLSILARDYGCKILTVGTDCVFSGTQGGYSELSKKDADDVYGSSKKLGEVESEHVTIVRSSFIGNQKPAAEPMLLEWLLRKSKDAEVNGFTNHFWNGTTTFHLAKALRFMIQENFLPGGIFHLVPPFECTKFELLEMIIREFGRNDLKLLAVEDEVKVDRRLTTIHPEFSETIWSASADGPNTKLGDLIRDLAQERKILGYP